MNFIVMFSLNYMLVHYIMLSSVFAKESAKINSTKITNKSVTTNPKNIFDVLSTNTIFSGENGNYFLTFSKQLIEALNKVGLIFGSDLDNQDIYLNVTELIRKNGYQVEEYEVETEDGYLLLLVRIRGSGPPVFLMHGIVLSSDDWVTAGPDIGIAYLLAVQGYDVWMGNARGNKHSRKHRTLSPNTAAFWNFSYYEIGIYDLPAMIDYTLRVTKQKKLVFVGHSQGTTSFFVMASERPEYNTKVSLMVALAPIGNAAYAKSLIYLILKVISSDNVPLVFKTLRQAGTNELFANDITTQAYTTLICSQSFFQNTICKLVQAILTGYDESQTYPSTRSVIYSHSPAGSATKQFEHYAQTASSRKFRKFDYGEENNLKLYSSRAPPEFPTQNITTPIVFFYGEKDVYAPPEDVIFLRQQFSSIIGIHRVAFSSFVHLDFLYAKDLRKLVFVKMLHFIREYITC